MQKIAAINLARKLLIDKPYDIYHTIEHHQNVYQNCIAIYLSEKLTCNLDLLETAAWWHDVFKGNESEPKLLKQNLLKVNLDPTDINAILNIINEHSFGNIQTSIEAKVLYDADKLELISIPRWKYVFDSVSEGITNKEEGDRYIPEWNRRMPILLDELNFSYSNKIFCQKYEDFIEWAQSIGRYDKGILS